MKDAISSEPGKPVLPAVPKSLSAWAASPAGQRLHHLPRTRQRSGRLCTHTLAGPRVRTPMCTCSTGVHARPLRTPQAGAGSRRLHCPCSSQAVGVKCTGGPQSWWVVSEGQFL